MKQQLYLQTQNHHQQKLSETWLGFHDDVSLGKVLRWAGDAVGLHHLPLRSDLTVSEDGFEISAFLLLIVAVTDSRVCVQN